MEPLTSKLWEMQNRHDRDRVRLFTAVAEALSPIDECVVLYPGSFVDVSASAVFSQVIYIDSDRRAPRFFEDRAGVEEILEGIRVADRPGPASSRPRTVDFVHADYRDVNAVGLEDESVDLLVSLYAGFVSEHCTRYLRLGGALLVNPSHGDAAMASIDDRYRLSGVVKASSGRYRVDRSDLDSYMVPKRDEPLTVERLHELGKGIGYTKRAFAYLFERVK